MKDCGGSVGIFDSGIGGLTVLKECINLLPDTAFFYYGDNGNAPYGSKSEEEITRLVRAALLRFYKLGVDAVVLACNTATAVCAEKLRKEFSFPIVGMEPAVHPAALACRKALVLATPRTAESARLFSLVHRFPQCEITVHACPDLAGDIERCKGEFGKIRLGEYLPAGKYDGVVLGCTHYVFLKDRISEFYGVPVYDGNEGAAKRLRTLLNMGWTTTPGDASKMCGFDYINTNNCSENREKTAKIQENSSVFFLGTDKNINKMIYKQMFAYKNG